MTGAFVLLFGVLHTIVWPRIEVGLSITVVEVGDVLVAAAMALVCIRVSHEYTAVIDSVKNIATINFATISFIQ